jgi:hypothetical protein
MKLIPIGLSNKLVFLKRRYSWNYFRAKAQVVPGSYSESFAKKTYDSIFINSKDLLDEYHQYYDKEYLSLSDFLFWRHGISREIINELKPKKNNLLVFADFGYYVNENEVLDNAIEHLIKVIDGE